MAASQAHHGTYDLAGRGVMITGAFGTLGSACVQAFLAAGARVTGIAHRMDATRLDALRAQAGVAAARLHLLAVDLAAEGQVAAAVAEVVARQGRLDVLVNTVGGYAAGQPVHELDEATWQHMLDINLHATYLVSKHAARAMLAQRWGRIINVSSRAAVSGRRNAAAYAVSKAAVITLTEAQAEELRDAGITVNAVLPSTIDTPSNRADMPRADASRWVSAAAIARVIVFLASDDAAPISGASIPVYGRA